MTTSVRSPSAPAALTRRGYLPALDGLRAVAVLAVLAYHAGASWLPGGFLGVDIFFALSGYLITYGLALDWERDRQLSLGRFYRRRGRRLLPALFLVLAAVAVYCVIALPEESYRLRGIWSPPSRTARTGPTSIGTSRTSRRSAGRRCCSTCGRSPSKSSSIWCGRSC